MKLKGFKKLSLQIGVLSLSMIALSFFTETQFWIDHFNYQCSASADHYHIGGIFNYKHFESNNHFNYRGYVYVLTGFTFFVISIVKIFTSHKEDDFKN